jgi:hypothetical protein
LGFALDDCPDFFAGRGKQRAGRGLCFRCSHLRRYRLRPKAREFSVGRLDVGDSVVDRSAGALRTLLKSIDQPNLGCRYFFRRRPLMLAFASCKCRRKTL